MIDLKKVRTEKGMTQQQVADEIHCARTVIANIECGFTQPSVETAKAIAKVLDFNWWNFFEEEDNGNTVYSAGSCETSEN